MSLVIELLVAVVAVVVDGLSACLLDNNKFNKLGSWLVLRSMAIAGAAVALAFFWSAPVGASPVAFFPLVIFGFSVGLEYIIRREPRISEVPVLSLAGSLFAVFVNLPGIAAIAFGILYAKGFLA